VSDAAAALPEQAGAMARTRAMKTKVRMARARYLIGSLLGAIFRTGPERRSALI
jgi:hypothetical protein